MLIGIDGNEANVEKRVGIGVYAFELLKQFEKFQISSIRQAQDINFKFQIYLKNKPLNHLPQESGKWRYRVIGPKVLWTQIGLPFDLYTNSPRPDVFFSPTHYAPRFSPIPTAVSVMDVSYLHYPELFAPVDLYQLKHWTAYSVRKAKRVFTISIASKNDIIKAYTVEPERVVVTYPGIKTEANSTLRLRLGQEFKMQNSKVIEDTYGINGNYILFVGTLQPRKNIVRLIEAFAKIVKWYSSSERSESRSKFSTRRVPYGNPSSSSNSKIKLVIIGKKGWLFEDILSAPAKFGVEDTVVFLHEVTEDELPTFYAHAACFVLPSLYEGFGLPVLEAMQQGCPVIASNVSSLPEAGGNAAVYVDPENTDDIAKKIKEVLENEKLRESMIKKGYEQVKKFSWEKTATKTLEVLEEIAVQGKG